MYNKLEYFETYCDEKFFNLKVAVPNLIVINLIFRSGAHTDFENLIEFFFPRIKCRTHTRFRIIAF